MIRRHLFTLAAAVSLLLCVAVFSIPYFALAHRGCWATTSWTDGRYKIIVFIQRSGWDGVGVWRDSHTLDYEGLPQSLDATRKTITAEFGAPNVVNHSWRQEGNWIYPEPNATVISGRRYGKQIYSRYECRWRPVAASFSILPLLWALARLWEWLHTKYYSRSEGVCRVCSYNLTGNTSGICPECGTAVAEGGGMRREAVHGCAEPHH
jgi:hypothetical protein